jgi:transposase-like protein
MPQIQLPIFPSNSAAITNELAIQEREGTVWYFKGHLPVFSHPVEDIGSFRFFTSQLIANGNASQSEISRAFGVPLVSVKRACKKLREEGAGGFFSPAGAPARTQADTATHRRSPRDARCGNGCSRYRVGARGVAQHDPQSHPRRAAQNASCAASLPPASTCAPIRPAKNCVSKSMAKPIPSTTPLLRPYASNSTQRKSAIRAPISASFTAQSGHPLSPEVRMSDPEKVVPKEISHKMFRTTDDFHGNKKPAQPLLERV